MEEKPVDETSLALINSADFVRHGWSESVVITTSRFLK